MSEQLGSGLTAVGVDFHCTIAPAINAFSRPYPGVLEQLETIRKSPDFRLVGIVTSLPPLLNGRFMRAHARMIGIPDEDKIIQGTDRFASKMRRFLKAAVETGETGELPRRVVLIDNSRGPLVRAFNRLRSETQDEKLQEALSRFSAIIFRPDNTEPDIIHPSGMDMRYMTDWHEFPDLI